MTALVSAVVIGIGNEFRRDDGVGRAVAALVRERAAARPLPPGTKVRECDGDPGRLIGMWENTGLAVVVDACFPAAPRPGRIHRWCPAPGALARPAAGRHSTHGLGLAETVRLSHGLGCGPRRLVVYAVEGADRSLGTGLTPSVAEALLPVAERVEADVVRHAGAAPRPHPGA